jgi:Domain of unknown function (DUF4864)
MWRNSIRTLAVAAQILIASALVFASSPVRAQAAPDTAIRATISAQLDAMNTRDDATAFAIASPMIQQMFGNAATFMTMVERSYPQVFKSRGVRFLNLTTVEGQLTQRVVIESDAGTVIGNYQMIEVDNIWRINGCTFEKRDDA